MLSKWTQLQVCFLSTIQYITLTLEVLQDLSCLFRFSSVIFKDALWSAKTYYIYLNHLIFGFKTYHWRVANQRRNRSGLDFPASHLGLVQSFYHCYFSKNILEIFKSFRIFGKITITFVVTTVPADDLAPLRARQSAGTGMTSFWSCIYRTSTSVKDQGSRITNQLRIIYTTGAAV